MHIPKSYRVRGVYFDRDMGLFLVKTPKSARSDRFTLPGGSLDDYERVEQGFIRKFVEDIGCKPIFIKEPFIYKDVYQSQRKDVITLAYEVTLPDVLRSQLKKGRTPNGNDYVFYNLADIQAKKENLTLQTRAIIESSIFQDFLLSKALRR